MKKKHFIKIIFSLFPLLLASCSLLPQLPTRSINSSNSSSEETISSSKNDRTSNSKSSSSYHVHSFSEWQVSKAATCTGTGTEVRTCSGCDLAETKVIPALGHEWTEWYEGAAPTCEMNGSRGRSCLRCNIKETEDIPALGHDWEIKEVIQEGTCEQDTIVKEVCKRCLKEQTTTIPEGGHNYQLVDYSVPLYGYAHVRLYSCTFCEKTYLSFDVNQVTDDSRPHLYYENNGQGKVGAKFWGRPIGNDVELYESDDGVYADENAHEPVFNENQLGDYFEFSFSLTNQQAALLSNCRLYCDAKPAPYLGGMDFWARKTNDVDWTPGFYISGERKGELITDYRYCLYVDDTLQYFDPNIKVPAKGRGSEGERSEYVMPYDFHLHSGVNKIRLHMAGGYRSTFYNFIFRTYEESLDITGHRWGGEESVAPLGEGYVGYKKSICLDNDATRLAIHALDGTLGENSNFKSGTLEGFMKLSSNNNYISYKFNYSGKATKAKFYQYAYIDNFQANAQRTYTSIVSGQMVGPSGCNFGINFNNQEVEITEETKAITYEEFFRNATEDTGNTNNSKVGPCYIGEVNLVNGDNIFTYTRYSSYNLIIKDFWIVID